MEPASQCVTQKCITNDLLPPCRHHLLKSSFQWHPRLKTRHLVHGLSRTITLLFPTLICIRLPRSLLKGSRPVPDGGKEWWLPLGQLPALCLGVLRQGTNGHKPPVWVSSPGLGDLACLYLLQPSAMKARQCQTLTCALWNYQSLPRVLWIVYFFSSSSFKKVFSCLTG